MLLFLLFTISSFTLANSYTLLDNPLLIDKPKPVPLRLASFGLKDKPKPIPLRLASLYDPKRDRKPEPRDSKQTSGCSNINYVFTAEGQSQTITSPGYSGNYPSNANCSWYFTSPDGTTMTTNCLINIKCSNNDYIYFSPTGDGSSNIKYCGNGTTPVQTSVSNKFSIGFRSSYFSIWDIFNIFGSSTYNFKCTVTVQGTTASTTTQATTTTTSGSTTSGSTTTSASTTTAVPGSCSCGVYNPNGATRIVGGTQTLAGEIPWRIDMFLYNPLTGSGYVCGGTVISNSWIMTAAHCTANYQPGWKILVYTEAQANPVSVGGGKENAVDRYVQHPQYDPNTMNNDISLLHLTTPLVFKSNVSPACLPWNLISTNFSGTSVLASGWGTTKPVPVGQQNNDATSDTLLKVILPVLTTSECRAYLSQITDNMICTYLPGKDTCQGDSGGSIDYHDTNSTTYYAIGVVSWGYGCAQADNPGVYTKVANYLPWIQTTTGDNFCKI